jgi:hypothetical protein
MCCHTKVKWQHQNETWVEGTNNGRWSPYELSAMDRGNGLWNMRSSVWFFVKYLKWSQNGDVMHVCKSVCVIPKITISFFCDIRFFGHILIFAEWLWFWLSSIVIVVAVAAAATAHFCVSCLYNEIQGKIFKRQCGVISAHLNIYDFAA